MRFIDQGARAVVAGLVLLVHLVLGWILVHQQRLSARSSPPIAPLNLIAIAPNAVPRISTVITVDPLRVTAVDVEPPFLNIPDVEEAPKTIDRSTGRTIPPRPLDPSIDARPYALRAGIPSGVGVTVVLRIEVLTSGSVGRVEVDVSGGSEPIDAAAIEYVRSLKWIVGRIDDQPETLWVRWGVHLAND